MVPNFETKNYVELCRVYITRRHRRLWNMAMEHGPCLDDLMPKNGWLFPEKKGKSYQRVISLTSSNVPLFIIAVVQHQTIPW